MPVDVVAGNVDRQCVGIAVRDHPILVPEEDRLAAAVTKLADPSPASVVEIVIGSRAIDRIRERSGKGIEIEMDRITGDPSYVVARVDQRARPTNRLQDT